MSDHASNLGAAVNAQAFGKAGAYPELEQSQSFRASPCACIMEYCIPKKRLSIQEETVNTDIVKWHSQMTSQKVWYFRSNGIVNLVK